MRSEQEIRELADYLRDKRDAYWNAYTTADEEWVDMHYRSWVACKSAVEVLKWVLGVDIDEDGPLS